MLKKLIITAAFIFILAYSLPGVNNLNIWTALIASLVLAILNMFLRPILLLFSLPINILSLGLFTFIINAFIISLVGYLVYGFSVDNFAWALLLSFLISFLNSLFNNHK